ncbi:MAG: glycosyltransferase family 4 protein [Deltaproteobacteria bacterium]|nr:glycosyltransferase family 4 protein [Deltaproteobacteria bacterium]
MHVAFVTRHADWRGGAEHYVATAASQLRERGFRCTLLSAPDGGHDASFCARFDAAFPLVDPAAQARELRPDVLYVHQVRGVEATRRLADAPVPAVRFLHDHAPFCLREHKYTAIGHRTCTRTIGLACYACPGQVVKSDAWPGVRLVTLDALRAEQREIRRFAALAVGSDYMRRHAIAHGFDASSLHLLPLPVPPPPPGPLPDGRQARRVLVAGALVRGKGIDVAIRALAGLPCEVRLRVVGSGPQEALIRAVADRAGVASRVEWAGRLEGEALEAQYRTAGCVVVPSREPETFGFAGPLALRHGAPVVAADAGGMGEWLVPGVTGLSFPSGDAVALAAAIRRVLGDPAAARAMGEAGRDLVATRFRPEAHADALYALLARVAGGR